MRRGFTLLEVVVALLVLEVSVVGVVGALALASSTLSRADALERATAVTSGVLDSLARHPRSSRVPGSAGADSVVHAAGRVSWSVDDSQRVTLRATDQAGRLLLDVHSVLPSAW